MQMCNLTNDGTSSYTWDRANRLLSHAGHSYAYDGDGRRTSQTVSSVVTKYLLDTQPGLSVVLSQTVDDTDTTHYVHGPRGLHAVQEPAGEWMHPITDALGSIRGYIDPTGGVLSTVHYGEWGVPSAGIVGPAFTGEWRDANALQYHRARYYAPGLAVWTALDPWEGLYERPMSLNGYSWVEGRVVNATDASGEGVSECEVRSLEAQVRCYHARQLLDLYPESESLDFWLRFSRESLRELSWQFNSSEAYALVPLNFSAPDVKGQGAIDVLRRMESEMDRPLTFSEILAMIIESEAASVLLGNIPVSYCGLTPAQFKRNLELAIIRHFHGQCRRDSGRSGECGPDRLINSLLNGIQGWYDNRHGFGSWQRWLQQAQQWITDYQGWGARCHGQNTLGPNSPYTWGNVPSLSIPLMDASGNELPRNRIVGQSRIIDFIDWADGDYQYFVLQYASACDAPAGCLGEVSVFPGILKEFCIV